MRIRVAAVAASLTLLTATVAGCSGNDAKSSGSAGNPTGGASVSAGPPPDPCKLVTKEDLQKALGESFEQSSLPPTDPGRQTCSYDASETGHHVDINTYADPGGGGGVDAAYQNLLQGAKDVGGTPVQIDGIGDAAFRSNAQLYAKMKGYVLNIVIDGLGSDETTDKALEELGREAASRA
jgi:Protein of unknown function (DUF3558)